MTSGVLPLFRRGVTQKDPQGEAFRRSWCVLEMAVATGVGEAPRFFTGGKQSGASKVKLVK